MTDSRLDAIYAVMRDNDLDAVAFVPGSNFKSVFTRNFHLMERPLLVIVPSVGEAVAIVPNLEMTSFAALGFDGQVFDWRDEDGYQAAFAAAAAALSQLANAKRFGLEAQRMRVFEQMALASVFPDVKFVDAHAAISSVRLTRPASQ